MIKCQRIRLYCETSYCSATTMAEQKADTAKKRRPVTKCTLTQSNHKVFNIDHDGKTLCQRSNEQRFHALNSVELIGNTCVAVQWPKAVKRGPQRDRSAGYGYMSSYPVLLLARFSCNGKKNSALMSCESTKKWVFHTKTQQWSFLCHVGALVLPREVAIANDEWPSTLFFQSRPLAK